jgi:hypothetical protein
VAATAAYRPADPLRHEQGDEHVGEDQRDPAFDAERAVEQVRAHPRNAKGKDSELREHQRTAKARVFHHL